MELFYHLALKRTTAAFRAAIHALVDGRIKDFAKPEGDEKKTDAQDDESPNKGAANVLRRQMKGRVKAIGSSATKAAATAGERVVKHVDKEAERLGLNIVKATPLESLIKQWAKEQAARIKGMHEHQVDRIADILSDGYGRSAESLGADIDEQIDEVTASRAEFIARDSILTLNSKVVQYRAREAEIDTFIWTTSGDERVRDEHVDLDGEELPMDEGDPDEGFPGEPIACRCTMFFQLPELDGDEQEEPEESDES